MSWSETEFENLYAIPSKNGLTRPARVRGSGHKMINMGELFANDRIGNIKMELVPMNERELSSMLVEQGDLLFARQSLVLAGAGKCSIVSTADEPTTFESHIIRVRLNRMVADPVFYHYYFKSSICRIRSIVIQGVQAGIRGNDLKKLRVHIPALETQQRISSILSAYDDLIENNRQRIQLLEQAARLLYKEWFVHLRFPGHEHVKIIDGVPEGWVKGTVADFGKCITGKTPSTKTPENFGGNILFVKTPDMHRNRIIIETEDSLSDRGAATQHKKTLPVGTILVACIGAKLGVVSITGRSCQTNQQINAVIPYENYMRHYILFALIDVKPRLEAMGGGATMPNVNKTKFTSIPVLIPSQRLLREFEVVSKVLFQQIELLEQQYSSLTSARDLLLPRLMNGEIAV